MAVYTGNRKLKEMFAGRRRIREAFLGGRLLWQYDSTAPALTVTAPAGTAAGSPTYTTAGTYRVQGTVSDTDSGVAAVYVNGAAATVNGSTWYKDISVAAETTATVRVYAADNAGNQTAVITRYVRYDSAAPSLAVTAPSGNVYTSGSSYTVSGTASDASGLKSLTVNGAAVSVAANGTWSRAVALSANAWTAVTVVATDKAGRTATVSRSIYYDAAAPSLAVTVPAGDVFTSGSSYTVSGTASDASGLQSLTVNGAAVSVAANGTWSRAVALSANAWNPVTVVATDKAGRKTTVTRSIYCDTIAPSLAVTNPSSTATVYTENTSYAVSGTASDATGIARVTVNGYTASMSSGSWSATIPLTAGTTNTITIVATDGVGRTSTAYRYIYAYAVQDITSVLNRSTGYGTGATTGTWGEQKEGSKTVSMSSTRSGAVEGWGGIIGSSVQWGTVKKVVINVSFTRNNSRCHYQVRAGVCEGNDWSRFDGFAQAAKLCGTSGVLDTSGNIEIPFSGSSPYYYIGVAVKIIIDGGGGECSVTINSIKLYR